MEVYGKSMVAGPSNVIYLSTILGRDGPIPVHKCDWKCENEHVCGNMYTCKLTGLTHICDKNCNQRILYDNHTSLCRVSGQIFPLTPAEEQAVRGVRRKLDAESSPSDSCAFKRRRDAQYHPSPFERSFSAVSPICSQVGDAMDMSIITIAGVEEKAAAIIADLHRRSTAAWFRSLAVGGIAPSNDAGCEEFGFMLLLTYGNFEALPHDLQP